MRSLIVAAAMLAAIPGAAFAQAHHGHGQHATAPAAEAASTSDYRQANDRMHKGMDIPFSGNADVDFVKGMIPHHQGAIDMAKVVLEHGKDEETRRLAEGIIREQEREIAEMKAWLKMKGAE